MSPELHGAGGTPFREDRTGIEARLDDARAAWVAAIPAAQAAGADLAAHGRRVGLGAGLALVQLGTLVATFFDKRLVPELSPFSSDLWILWLLVSIATLVFGATVGARLPGWLVTARLRRLLWPGASTSADLERLRATSPMAVVQTARYRWRRASARVAPITTGVVAWLALWAIVALVALCDGSLRGRDELAFLTLLTWVVFGSLQFLLFWLALPVRFAMPAWAFALPVVLGTALCLRIVQISGSFAALLLPVGWGLQAWLTWHRQHKAVQACAEAEAELAASARTTDATSADLGDDDLARARAQWLRAAPGAATQLPALAALGRSLGLRAGWLAVQAGCALATLVSFVLLLQHEFPGPDVVTVDGPSPASFAMVFVWTVFTALALGTLVVCVVAGHVVAPRVGRAALWRPLWPTGSADGDRQRLATGSPGEALGAVRRPLATWAARLRPWAAGSLLFHVLFVGIAAAAPSLVRLDDLPVLALALWVCTAPSQLVFSGLHGSLAAAPTRRATLVALALVTGGYALFFAGLPARGTVIVVAMLAPVWLVQLVVLRVSRGRAARELAERG